MSLSDDEKTVHDGQPRELYEFVVSGGTDRFYTDFREDISYSGDNYVAALITRGAIVGRSNQGNIVEVRMPYDLALLDELAFSIPPRKTVCTIYRYHGNLGNIGVIWTGEVTDVRLVGREASLRVSSIIGDQLDQEISSVAYHHMCNHVLYNTGCGLTAANFKTVTTVTAIGADPRVITVNALTDRGPSEWVGGEVVRTTDGERRLIIARAGLVLTLIREFRALSVTDAVDVYEGCDHSYDTCETQFSNTQNFGGHPNITSGDLFRFGIRDSKES